MPEDNGDPLNPASAAYDSVYEASLSEDRPDRVKLYCDVCDYEETYCTSGESPYRNCPRCQPSRKLRVLTREPDIAASDPIRVGPPYPDDGEHNADAPPGPIDAALARLRHQSPNPRYCFLCGAALDARRLCPRCNPPSERNAAPALPLEVAAAEVLELAESMLLDVADGTASYTDLAGGMTWIAALLRGGLGDA